METVDMKAMRKLEKSRKLRSQAHPYHNLSIWNYEEIVHYNDKWCPITLMSRALVVENDTGKIVGRALPKFFNHTEKCKTANIPEHNGDFRIFDKLDGSLFVLFNYKDEWIYCSRGSFISEQAKEGESILKNMFPQYVDLNKNLTYVFELIYPEGRIVVDYGPERTIKFLTAYSVNGTEHLIIDEMLDRGFNTVKEYHFDNKSLEEIYNLNTPNCEGFVIRYSDGSRVKVKFEEYIKLHKVRTNFSNKVIFENWKNNIPLEEALKNIPDEFNEWYRTGISQLNKKREEILTDIYNSVKILAKFDDSDFHREVNNYEFKKFIYMIRNGKDNEQINQEVISFLSPKDIKTNGPTARLKLLKKTPVAIFLIGPSGVGKSTWVNKFMRGRRDVIRVSRDVLRHALYIINDGRDSFDYYNHEDLNKREDIITNLCKKIANDAFANSKTVIFDNTNVDFDLLKSDVKALTSDVIVHFEIFNTELTAVELHQITVNRGMEVPKKIIIKQMLKMTKTISQLDELRNIQRNELIVQDVTLPQATIFDIDGTLAYHGDRNVYDMSRVNEDLPATHMIDLAKILYSSGMKIILCSGREEKARAMTCEWMDKFGVKFHELHMRPNKNTRKDYMIKEDMWRDLITRYHIIQMFDDRDQVVSHGRSLGFKVSQVADGNF